MAAASLALRLGTLLLLSTLALPVLAEDNTPAGHTGSGHMAHGTSSDPVIAGWQSINDQMHADMMIDYTGNPDVDFARGMIAHHKGAVAMAELVIANGSDPEIGALAEAIVTTQTEEIAFLEAWLARQGQ